MLSPICKNRLFNFKFGQAVEHLDADATDQEKNVVFALAYTFNDSGWFDGKMGDIVWAALRSLEVTEDG